MQDVLFQALRTHLLSDPRVRGFVEDRIYPLVIEQGAQLPALRYEQISGVPHPTQSGGGNLERARYQIGSVGSTYMEALATAQAVHDALHGFRGSSAGVRIQGAFREDSRDDYQPEADRVEVQGDYVIWAERI